MSAWGAGPSRRPDRTLTGPPSRGYDGYLDLSETVEPGQVDRLIIKRDEVVGTGANPDLVVPETPAPCLFRRRAGFWPRRRGSSACSPAGAGLPRARPAVARGARFSLPDPGGGCSRSGMQKLEVS